MRLSLSLKEETVIISFDENVLVEKKDIIHNQWIFLPLIGVSSPTNKCRYKCLLSTMSSDPRFLFIFYHFIFFDRIMNSLNKSTSVALLLYSDIILQT